MGEEFERCGCVVLDMVLDQMIASKQLKADEKDMTFDVLMAKHRHQHQKKESKQGRAPTL